MDSTMDTLKTVMKKPHILLVDDDVYVTEGLTTYLKLQGYRVTAAYGCRQAREKLRTADKVDLVILDYLMPDGSAVDLLRSLGEEKTAQKPPVIMSSGVLDATAPLWEELKKHLPVESQSLIQAYVNKPYTLDAMDVALHEVLGGDYLPSPLLSRRSQNIR
jgi:DNA-binding NtrC family response regulator